CQNGFRKERSTVDHLSSLSLIIETRKKKRLSTFTAFIDFRKAYDRIDRGILFRKLGQYGVTGKLLAAIKSIYQDVKSCVRINGLKTDWFDINCGLKQGCLLSPLLFNLYINDLITKLNCLCVGIDLVGEKVCALLYADDLVLMAETATDLQLLLDTLYTWTMSNRMAINCDKSSIVHFRPPSTVRTSYVFK
ncbi:RNA-directed DNA polymerase, partial [Solemya velum gill symbiont]|uniref:RNA-directed DNA polymerase n=1 Tax=Solemya velum gill symbiont TaxID=2340 RepID=UPI00117A57EE